MRLLAADSGERRGPAPAPGSGQHAHISDVVRGARPPPCPL